MPDDKKERNWLQRIGEEIDELVSDIASHTFEGVLDLIPESRKEMIGTIGEEIWEHTPERLQRSMVESLGHLETVHKYTAEPFGAMLTRPFWGDWGDPRTFLPLPQPVTPKEMERYREEAPGVLRFGAESIPYFALPVGRGAQVGGKLKPPARLPVRPTAPTKAVTAAPTQVAPRPMGLPTTPTKAVTTPPVRVRAGLEGAETAGAKPVLGPTGFGGLPDDVLKKLGVELAPDELAGISPAFITERIALPPVAERLTQQQAKQIWRLANEKLLVDATGKRLPQYRRLRQAFTGKRVEKLTREEGDRLIEALEALEVKGGRPPRIPTGTALIPQELAEKMPYFKDIGIIEQVRPSRQVLERIGLRREVFEPAFEAETKLYEELMAFRKELAATEKLVPKGSRVAVFEALENPALVAQLSQNETKAYQWFKGYFDDWANRLNLPPEKRRLNYVTHIFEEDLARQLQSKHPFDPELLRALDYTTPKGVFNPYLQQRTGATGVLKDPFRAASAYEARALKVYYYEPLIQRIRVYEKFLPPNSARYLRGYIQRITNRPTQTDNMANATLKRLGETIEKMPGGEGHGQFLMRGSPSGLLSYQYTSMLYSAWLGGRPVSAIRNLSQHALIIADTGINNFAQGIRLRFTAEGKAALQESLVLRSRKMAFVPGIDESFASRYNDSIREKLLWMFRQADKQNVSDAFLAGYSQGKSLGLPREWCIKLGDEVAANTQYIYTRLGGAAWSQSAMGRVLTPLTTWPINFSELVIKWASGRKSYVLTEYMAQTGVELPLAKNWLTRRKELVTYLLLLAGAVAAEETTRIKAKQYTGFTSIPGATQWVGGELPGLEIPGAVADMVAGTVEGRDWQVQDGWNRIRPDKFIGIVREINNVAQGDKDWLSMFIYLQSPTSRDKSKEFLATAEKKLGQPDAKGSVYSLKNFGTDINSKTWYLDDVDGFSDLVKFYHDSMDKFDEEYYSISGDPPNLRVQYRQEHPDLDALLFLWGRVSILRSQAAIPEIERMLKQYNIPRNAVGQFRVGQGATGGSLPRASGGTSDGGGLPRAR